MKFSDNEYTQEEMTINGNTKRGGKLHDEICDYLQKSYGFDEETINNISMGVWLVIDHNIDMKNRVQAFTHN